MKNHSGFVVLLIVGILLISAALSGCSGASGNRTDFTENQTDSLRTQSATMAASPYITALSTDKPKTSQPTEANKPSWVIPEYASNDMGEFKKFLKDNMDAKFKLGLRHFYSLVQADNNLVIEKYTVVPDSNTISVFAYRKSDSNKKIQFSWYYSEKSKKHIRETIGSSSVKKLRLGVQEYSYKVYNNDPVDKDDPGKHPPSVEVFWSQNDQYFRLYYAATPYSNELIKEIDKVVQDIIIE